MTRLKSSWGKPTSTSTAKTGELAYDSPTWLAQRTLVVDISKCLNGTELTLDHGASFSVDDSIAFLPVDESGTVDISRDVTSTVITKAVFTDKGMVYTLKETPSVSGQVMIVKYMTSKEVPEAKAVTDSSFVMIPVTRETLAKDTDKKLRNKGIVSPGWYLFRQVYKDGSSNIIADTVAELLVSMKGFTDAELAKAATTPSGGTSNPPSP